MSDLCWKNYSKKMDNKNIESLIETEYTSFTCAVCLSILPNREELSKHDCFDGKTIYSDEGVIYCLSDDGINSNEETMFNEFDHSNILDDHDDISIEGEQYIPQLEHTSPKKPKKDVATWTDKSTLALISSYEAKKEDLDHPIKRGKVSIADDLSELGYKFSGQQVRWKFNTLTRKYKECVDNSKRTGTGYMTFKFFDYMENILGDRRTIQGQSTISSTFAKKNLKSKCSSTMLSTYMDQSDNTSITSSTSIPSPSTLILSPSTSSTEHDKKRICKDPSKSKESNKNKQAILEKMTSSNTETSVCLTTVSDTYNNKKRFQHGSGSRTAAKKIELEKQWLQHLKNLSNKNEIKKEKQEAYEKRKLEEMQMKKKLIALKEKQLNIKQNTAKRKLEEAAEWHRDKLKIEKQKCQLLEELLETRTSSRNEMFKTDTDSSHED